MSVLHRRLAVLLSCLVLLLAAVSSASAVTYTWTNAYPWSVLWDDPLNWNPSGVPGVSDEALISPPPERGPAIDYDTMVGDIHGPRWDSDSNQVMDLVAGTIVISGEWAWCNSGSGTGTINISGSPYVIINGWFSGVHSGTGILNITGNAIVESSNEWRMVDSNAAVGVFNISGGANITVHERVRLADDGLAILNISGEPTITIDGDLTGGYNSGGTLEAHISGGSLSVGGSFQIGEDGSGIIDINGGVVNCRILRLQVRPGDARATLNVTGGDVYVEEGLRICEGSGVATMNMSGGNVNVGDLWLAGGDGIGTLNMTGGSLTVRWLMSAPRDSSSTCVINLDGGIIECGAFASAGAYSMNIEEGILVIDGDVRNAIYADIAAGYITAYGRCAGRGDMAVDFDNVNQGKTTVWAVPVFERAWNPWPSCDTEYVPEELILRWSPGEGAITHCVFFGTDFDDVNDYDPSVFKGCQAGATYYTGSLSFGVTYYWRIDEIGASTYTSGLVWSFTLGDIIVVDDMESYTAGWDSPQPITDVWIDGTTKLNGADVSLQTSTPVLGQQSMKYEYWNGFPFGAGYYSEIERQYPDPCNWTMFGVEALTLYFYGNPNNDAGDTEQPYVILEDSNGTYAEVRYPLEDMNDIKIAQWQEWNIDLQDFNNGGVDLTDVNTVYIGFGDRYNLFIPGGTGTVYFDDIILYPPRCVPEYGPVGDVSGDCVVDFKDLEIMSEEWLQSGEAAADVSEDGKVDFQDYAMLTNDWLELKLWPQ